MGISNSSLPLLLAATRNAVPAPKVATIGKQLFWPSEAFLASFLRTAALPGDAKEVMAAIGKDGSQFLRILGASHVDEVDASAYEGATIIHDMNAPLPLHLRGQYDLVYDGGCMEHIFDIRQTLLNLTGLVRVGGVFAGVSTANNLCGHGFYQFSPELFYRFFCPDNGWGGSQVLLCAHKEDPPRYWHIEDPLHLRRRIYIKGGDELYIMILSRKIADIDRLTTPQQSDYAAAWKREAPKPASHKSADLPPQRARGFIWRSASRLKWTCVEIVQGFLQRRRRRALERVAGALQQEGVTPRSISQLVQTTLPTSTPPL